MSRRANASVITFERQNDEPLAKSPSENKERQGTTSVVPQMANLDYGFSRCGIVNN
jgi:hypothetical protein